MIKITDWIALDEAEIIVTFIRASGFVVSRYWCKFLFLFMKYFSSPL